MNTPDKTEGLDHAIKEVGREVGMRRACYPKWVKSGRMTEEESQQRIAGMEAAYRILKALPTKDEKIESLKVMGTSLTLLRERAEEAEAERDTLFSEIKRLRSVMEEALAYAQRGTWKQRLRRALERGNS